MPVYNSFKLEVSNDCSDFEHEFTPLGPIPEQSVPMNGYDSFTSTFNNSHIIVCSSPAATCSGIFQVDENVSLTSSSSDHEFPESYIEVTIGNRPPRKPQNKKNRIPVRKG